MAPYVSLLVFILVPLIVGIAIIIVMLKKQKQSKEFLASDNGKEIAKYLLATRGLSEIEYNRYFKESGIPFDKAAKYLLYDEDLDEFYEFDKTNRLLKAKLVYEPSFSFETSVSYIKFIDNQIELFSKNTELKKIAKTIQAKKGILYILELSSICTDMSPNAAVYCANANESVYSKFLAKTFFESELTLTPDGLSKIDILLKSSELAKEVKNIFELLIKQNIIKIPDTYKSLSFNAFCFSLYKYILFEFSYVDSTLNELQLDFENDESNSIKKMINAYGESSTINFYICYKCIKENETILSCRSKCEMAVKKEITKQEDEKKLDELINGAKPNSLTINDLDLMNGVEFEKEIANIFLKSGYQCSMTKNTDDKGIDIVAIKATEKVGIQCKRYNEPVGSHSIMEVVGGSKYYGCTKLIVVSNNYFTKSAKELAKVNNVILWDRDELTKRL